MKTSRTKKIAVGAAVVGAFVAGAVAGIRNKQVKAVAAKAGRRIKLQGRKVRSAAMEKVSGVRAAVLA